MSGAVERAVAARRARLRAAVAATIAAELPDAVVGVTADGVVVEGVRLARRWTRSATLSGLAGAVG